MTAVVSIYSGVNYTGTEKPVYADTKSSLGAIGLSNISSINVYSRATVKLIDASTRAYIVIYGPLNVPDLSVHTKSFNIDITNITVEPEDRYLLSHITTYPPWVHVYSGVNYTGTSAVLHWARPTDSLFNVVDLNLSGGVVSSIKVPAATIVRLQESTGMVISIYGPLNVPDLAAYTTSVTATISTITLVRWTITFTSPLTSTVAVKLPTAPNTLTPTTPLVDTVLVTTVPPPNVTTAATVPLSTIETTPIAPVTTTTPPLDPGVSDTPTEEDTAGLSFGKLLTNMYFYIFVLLIFVASVGLFVYQKNNQTA